MQESISELKSLLQNSKILNAKLNNVISEYSFFELSNNFNFDKNNQIIKNFKESKVIIIDEIEKELNKYFIISFKKTLVFVNQNSASLINLLFSNNSNLSICFLSDIKQVFDQYHDTKYTNIVKDQFFEMEIKSFNFQLSISKKSFFEEKHPIWEDIKSCISGYLIKQSQLKNEGDRFLRFEQEENKKEVVKEWDEEEYFELLPIGEGSIFSVCLIYSIEEEEEIFALKKPHIIHDEIEKLFKREEENY